MIRIALKFGAFVLVCLFFTLYLAFTIGNLDARDPLGRNTYKVTASFDDVTGLLPNDNVKVAGVVVGKVTKVSPHGAHDLDRECSAQLAEAGIARVSGPCGGFAIEGERMAFDTAEVRMAFDSVYPALGTTVRSELAQLAGAETSEDRCIVVDEHLETTLPGLFAAGDVVVGLDQISHAMGQAGVAATAIRNHLAMERPIRR